MEGAVKMRKRNPFLYFGKKNSCFFAECPDFVHCSVLCGAPCTWGSVDFLLWRPDGKDESKGTGVGHGKAGTERADSCAICKVAGKCFSWKFRDFFQV